MWFLTRLFAIDTFFSTLVPSLPIFVYLLIVGAWLNQLPCDQIPVVAFLIFWMSMLVITVSWAVIKSLRVQKARLDRNAYVSVQTMFATSFFVAVSVIRGTPFHCYELTAGPTVAYLFGPIFFGTVLLGGIVYALVLAFTFRLKDLERYVRIGNGRDDSDSAGEDVVQKKVVLEQMKLAPVDPDQMDV
jgi:hypothetical protein